MNVHLKNLSIGLIYIFFLFSFSAFIVFYLHTPTGVDSWFHLSYSSILFERGVSDFKWLPFTIYREGFPDHHFGFHILLSYLSIFDDLRANARFFLIFQSAFILLSINHSIHLLTNKPISSFFVPACLCYFAVSSLFNVRLFMVRAHGLSVCLIALFIVYTILNKRLGMFLISLLLSIYFNLQFLYLPALVLLHYLTDIKSVRKFLTNLTVTISGGTIGLLFHPDIFATLEYTYFYLFKKTILPSTIDVGLEWYPLTFFVYFSHTYALGLLLFSIIFFTPKNSIVSKNKTYLYIILFFLLLLSIKSSRHIEQLVTPLFIFGFSSFVQWIDKKRDRFCINVLIYLIALTLFSTTLTRSRYDSTSYDFISAYNQSRNACAWIEEHTEPNEIIVNLDWSIFPILFAHNTHNRYVWGLDPKYLYYEDRELFKGIYSFRENTITGEEILNMFHAKYVVIFLNGVFHDLNSYNKLIEDMTVGVKYKDKNVVVFGRE